MIEKSMKKKSVSQCFITKKKRSPYRLLFFILRGKILILLESYQYVSGVFLLQNLY